MTTERVVDPHSFMHWMNARKVIPPMVAEATGIDLLVLTDMMQGARQRMGDTEASCLADALHIHTDVLLENKEALAVVLYRSRAELEATCRGINREGIHFYNYYTLPSPKGQIAPVVLDILCPSDRKPTQNNGHLEPAITINLGPGDINGLWGEELNEHTWHPLRSNESGEHNWVRGDSYVEPAYCPHTYSLVDDEVPARILSYTVKTHLESLFARTNGWTGTAFDGMVGEVVERGVAAFFLAQHMGRRGYDTDTLSAESGISNNALHAFLDGNTKALNMDGLRRVALTLAMDYRLLLKPDENRDLVGKTWCSIDDSIASIRPFRSYTVASMSMSPNLPDLIGIFMKADKPLGGSDLDLSEMGSSHYLVTGGSPEIHWEEGGEEHARSLEPWDSLWVGPQVRHGFSGEGALIKMGNGERYGYLDQFEMSNTFDLAGTLKRGRHDSSTWGYDE